MRIAMLLLLAPLVVACSAVKTAVDPESPKVTADKATLTKISPAGLELLVDLSVTNPNEMDLEARSLTAKVVLDGRYDMGTVDVPQEVELPSDQQIHVAVPVAVDWKDVTTIAALVALKRNVPYDIDGSVKIGVDLIKFDVPFHVGDVITEEQLRDAAGLPPDGGLR